MAASGGHETIRYGDDPSQFGELSLPSGTPRGVVVVIHGGFWKAAYDLVARAAARRRPGRERAGPRSTSSTGASATVGACPSTLDDVRAAIDTLDRPRPRPDPGRHPGPLGRRPPRGVGRPGARRWRRRSPHVISQAGVLDLVAADREGLGGGAVEALLGHPAGPADAAVDPRQQVPLDVPVWCVHGTDDDIVPISQSRDVRRGRHGGRCPRRSWSRSSGDHFVVIDPAHDAWRRPARDPRPDRLRPGSQQAAPVGCLSRAAGWRSSARSCATGPTVRVSIGDDRLQDHVVARLLGAQGGGLADQAEHLRAVVEVALHLVAGQLERLAHRASGRRSA